MFFPILGIVVEVGKCKDGWVERERKREGRKRRESSSRFEHTGQCATACKL